MICIVIFSLLHSNRYSSTTNNDATFALNDAYLYLGNQKLNQTTVAELELLDASSCVLHFTTQMNL